MNNIQLNSSEKIRDIRKAVHFTQNDLAVALGCTGAKISRIEQGLSYYNDEEIAAAKKILGVEKAPFTDKERMDFRQRLYRWKDLIRNRMADEARKNQKDLIVITKLPFERDLNTLYRMFEIRLVLAEANATSPEENIMSAEKMLVSEAPSIAEASEENQHHFFHNMGSLYFYKWDFKTALQYYLKSRSFEADALEKDFTLSFNLAACYSELGKYTLAITTMEEVYDLVDYNKTGVMRTYIDSSLAINYVRIGQVKRAKRILDKSTLESLDVNNIIHIGTALHNYGCACLRSKEYKEAISYYDRANEHFEIGDKYYIENMYWKIYCLIESKEVSKAKVLLSETKKYTEGNEHSSLIFESLSHLLTIHDNASIEFIEKKTIPYLVEKYEYFRVLDYCDALENKFMKLGKGYKIRILELTAIIRNITREITFGEEVVFDEKRIAGNHINANDGDEF